MDAEETPNPEPGAYYVSVRDGERYGLLAGPFVWHRDALAWVARVRRLAHEVDRAAVWYGFGTARAHTPRGPGLLNDRLGITAADLAGG
jgi:hypothetical protein